MKKKLLSKTILLKFLLSILLLCFLNLSFAKTADAWENCQDKVKDASNQVQELNLYYYRLALCRAGLIRNNQQFEQVINDLQKATNATTINLSPQAYFAIGFLYENKYKAGDILYHTKGFNSKDLQKAITHYEQSSALGCAQAEYYLGKIYLKKLSPPHKQLPDFVKSFYWLSKAAKNGSPLAQHALSLWYKQNPTISNSLLLAYLWQNTALQNSDYYNNYLPAIVTESENRSTWESMRNQLYRSLTPLQKKQAQKLKDTYTRNYVKPPTEAEKSCLAIESVLIGNNLGQLFENRLSVITKSKKNHSNQNTR